MGEDATLVGASLTGADAAAAGASDFGMQALVKRIRANVAGRQMGFGLMTFDGAFLGNRATGGASRRLSSPSSH